MDVGQGTLPAGFQFGAYVIGSCIGRGGMARIYRAEHRVLHKPVALKVMESALLERPDGRPRFLREGQAAAAVKHPNVVDITDVGVWQGRPYLVMELLEGEDLEQYLSRHKPLAEQDVARIMIPIIAGLATAHAAGVIHRDLKPSNVFLARGPDDEVVPKLLDFGISKLANALRTLDPASTPLGELMGSPMYMSPEAVRGARDLSPQSDQYSLGVILYECVTGRPPFYGDSLLGVLEAVAHGHFESPRRFRPELSTVLEVAILRAMSRDPADRFPSVRELGRALCEAADQRTRLLWTPSFGVRELPQHRSTANLGVAPLGMGTLRPGSLQTGQIYNGQMYTGQLHTGQLRTGSLYTGSPLSASVSGRPRRFPYWQLGLTALALSMLMAATLAYWRVPGAPYAEGMSPAATSPVAPAATTAALPPAGLPPAGLSHSASALQPAAPAVPPPERAAGDVVDVASGVASPSTGSPPDARVAPVPSTTRGAPAVSPARSAPPRAASPPVPTRPAPVRRSAAEDEAPAPRKAPPPAEPEAAAEPPAMPEPGDADEVVFPRRAPSPSRPTPVLGANQAPILD